MYRAEPSFTAKLDLQSGRQVSMTYESIREVYQRADVNGDNNVSRAELVESVRKDPALQCLFELPLGR
jgi:hypothetical protein